MILCYNNCIRPAINTSFTVPRKINSKRNISVSHYEDAVESLGRYSAGNLFLRMPLAIIELPSKSENPSFPRLDTTVSRESSIQRVPGEELSYPISRPGEFSPKRRARG